MIEILKISIQYDKLSTPHCVAGHRYYIYSDDNSQAYNLPLQKNPPLQPLQLLTSQRSDEQTDKLTS